MKNAVDLLKELVEKPSVSGNEEEIAGLVHGFLASNNAKPVMQGKNVYASKGEGKHLLLVTHLDTVPPTENWTRDPFLAEEKEGKIYGLGSNDAKGCLAAMAIAFLESEPRGKITFAATHGEEIGNLGVQELLSTITPDTAIVGEPTSLKACIAQKGLMIVKFTSQGKEGHAANAQENLSCPAKPSGKEAAMPQNALHEACKDVTKIAAKKFSPHPLLGSPTAQVTVFNAGKKNNVVPGKAEFIVDVRTTPNYSSKQLLAELCEGLSSTPTVLSDRYPPKETPATQAIAQAAAEYGFTASNTTSDWAFIPCPAIKFGPGHSKNSHTPDEYIEVQQLEQGVQAYKKIISNYFGGMK